METGATAARSGTWVPGQGFMETSVSVERRRWRHQGEEALASVYRGMWYMWYVWYVWYICGRVCGMWYVVNVLADWPTCMMGEYYINRCCWTHQLKLCAFAFVLAFNFLAMNEYGLYTALHVLLLPLLEPSLPRQIQIGNTGPANLTLPGLETSHAGMQECRT